MLKIRLQRIGKKNSPSYRIVLVEHTSSSKSGRYIELLGSYDSKSKQRNFKKDRIQYWFSKGVQLSPTIHNLLVDEKIIDKAKVKAWKPKKRPASAEATAGKAEAKSAVEAEKPATPETPKTEESKTEELPKEEEAKSEEAPKVDEPKPVEEPKPEPSLDTGTKKE